MNVYIIEKIAFDDQQNPIHLGVLYCSSSIEAAQTWIQRNYRTLPDEDFTWLFLVSKEPIDAVKQEEDEEYHLFDSNGVSIKD